MTPHLRTSYFCFLICVCFVAGVEWSEFTPWTKCSTTCGFGSRQRQSHRLNLDGSKSNKTITEYATCSSPKVCPVHGNWTMWQPWTYCSKRCGPGEQERTRQCTNPTPAHGGMDCTGEKKETQACEREKCPSIPAYFSLKLCVDDNAIFMCDSTLQCVNKTERCDRKLHCHDGSDEVNCRYTNNAAGSFFNVLPFSVLFVMYYLLRTFTL